MQMTKYEIEILRIISESHEHLTADEVFDVFRLTGFDQKIQIEK